MMANPTNDRTGWIYLGGVGCIYAADDLRRMADEMDKRREGELYYLVIPNPFAAWLRPETPAERGF